MARIMKAACERERFSKSLASLLQRPSQPNVRSTIQRLGSTMKPVAVSDRLMISSGILASAHLVGRCLALISAIGDGPRSEGNILRVTFNSGAIMLRS